MYMCVHLMELSVRDRGDRVRGLGLATDYLGREVGQSHHSQDLTADRLCIVILHNNVWLL